jgi:hypothetical protein
MHVSPQYNSASPAFGSKARVFSRLGSSLDTFIPFTQKISEDFFWQFMALDVLGLWMTRVRNSLIRGRQEYKPEQDPSFTPNLSEPQQMAKIAGGFLKGLNWRYFGEEAGREFTIGPGILILTAGLYGLYRPLIGKGLFLPNQRLTQLGDTFGQQAAGSFQQAAQGFLHNLVPDADLKAAVAGPLQTWQDAWTHHAEKRHLYRTENPTALRARWALQRWAQDKPFGGKIPLPEPLKALMASEQRWQTAEARLKQAIFQYNEQHIPDLKYHRVNRLPITLLHREKGGLKANLVWEDIDTFFHQLGYFQEVASRMLTRHQQGAKSWAEAVTHTLNSVTRTKAIAVVMTTFLVGNYAQWLTRQLQGSKEYPGNRSRRIEDITRGT